MPRDLIDVAPRSQRCGERVVRAVEFAITHRVARKEAWAAALALIAEVTLLALFMTYLYQGNLTGNEPRIILKTCLGAMLGVVLAYLIGATLRNERISYVSVLKQFGLAILLGVLYGLFSFEIGSIYNAEIRTWHEGQVGELANRMALLGIAVGALLGPASKLAIQNLRRTAELD
jgi:membrane associated rhomboid family serine protease